MKRILNFVLRLYIISPLVFCALAGGALWLWLPRHRVESTNPDVLNPVFAVDYLQKFDPRSVYFTLSAHNYLAAKKPDWVSPFNTAQGIQALFHAGEDAVLWRRLDHQFHFDAVLLCGNPSEYQPLLQHLLTSPDWTMVYLDHAAIIFRHPPAPAWSPADLEPLRGKFASYPPVDHAAFLTQCASKLLAITQPALAKQQLDESLALNRDSADTWTQLALYDLRTHKQKQALEDSGRALKLDKTNYYALMARIQVLAQANRFEEALQISRSVMKDHMNDSVFLYAHAMLAHDAFAYSEEIATLRRVIDIVSADKQPVAGFRVYLAQAYEMDGQGQPALDEFQKALDEGTLSAAEGQLIEMQMKSIEKQTSKGF